MEALYIGKVVFATPGQVAFSRHYSRDPRVTIQHVIEDINRGSRCAVPLIDHNGDNWSTWYHEVRRLIRKTNSSALFCHDVTHTLVTSSWKRFWWRIFYRTAPNIKPTSDTTPRAYLAAIMKSVTFNWAHLLATSYRVKTYQLDTAADVHCSGHTDDFVTLKPIDTFVEGVGGIPTLVKGIGSVRVPAYNGSYLTLSNVLYIPGQDHVLLSLQKLESAGFELRWPSKLQPVELISPDNETVLRFQREDGRLIWRPDELCDSASSSNTSSQDKPEPSTPSLDLNEKFVDQTLPSSVTPAATIAIKSKPSRDWHAILGHPGKRALKDTMRNADIKDSSVPTHCDVCTKSKITTQKGHGAIRTATAFDEVIHFDLVGGQTLLQPKTQDASAFAAKWFLLAVDECFSKKWAWPVKPKKAVPTQIRYFLEELKNVHNTTPKRIHTDGGTEFDGIDGELMGRGFYHRMGECNAHPNGYPCALVSHG